MDIPLVSWNPIARRAGVVVQEVPDEVLVYDLNTNKAHCLNSSAALIWKCCDGNNSIADIVHQLESNGGGKLTEDLVWLALDRLNENGLLENEIGPRFRGHSRRAAVKAIGMASAVALPMIASLVAPQRALGVDSCVCVSNSQCAQPGCTHPNCNALGICAPNPVKSTKTSIG